MKTRSARLLRRRQPKQRRARQTVDAILDAVAALLKHDGVGSVTTNRIAEVAGVSIGSLYQYFPDKRAIYVALHRRHIEEIDRLVQAKLVEHAGSPLEVMVRAMVEAMIDAHAADPRLYALLLSEVPHRAEGIQDFVVRLHGTFRLAIASKAKVRRRSKRQNLDKVVFTVTSMVEAFSHAAVLHRPPSVSLAAAREEAVRAVLAYLRA